MALAADSQAAIRDRSNSRSLSPLPPSTPTHHSSKILRSHSSLALSPSDAAADRSVAWTLATTQNDASQPDRPEVCHDPDPTKSPLGPEHGGNIGSEVVGASSARGPAVQFKNRPYGRPLSTILERSSYATLRSRLSHSSSKRRFTPVHIDPDSNYLHTESAPVDEVRRVYAFSFDESDLCDSRPNATSDLSSEQPSTVLTLRPSLENAIIPSLPPFEPPSRINTPEGLPRWPNDEHLNRGRKHSRRRSNPFLVISSFIRRASGSNERLQRRLWRPMPGIATPGFDGLENHPFHTAAEASQFAQSPACRSLSLTLRPSSVDQPPKPQRSVSATISRRTGANSPATVSLPRSLEIRNNRRAAASEEAFSDDGVSSGQLLYSFPTPPEILGRSISRENVRLDLDVPPPSPVLVPQQPLPEDSVTNSPLDLGEALQIDSGPNSPLQNRPSARNRDSTRAHQRLHTWSEESQSFLGSATRGDLEQRYACSGVPIYQTDAASDHTISNSRIELDHSEDDGNADEQITQITPENRSTRPEVVLISPELSMRGTTSSMPRDVAAASLSSRQLFTSPAISNARRCTMNNLKPKSELILDVPIRTVHGGDSRVRENVRMRRRNAFGAESSTRFLDAIPGFLSPVFFGPDMAVKKLLVTDIHEN
ncbi:MAG: hypothetical protein Q9165_000533 [Trypethelium subeluteriae]